MRDGRCRRPGTSMASVARRIVRDRFRCRVLAVHRARLYAARMKWLVRWMLLAAALLLVAHWFPGVSVRSFGSALIAALVLGLLNAFVRPVLILLTLPVTLLTLGLFIFVINALMFLLAGSILEGFQVEGFGWALAGSLVYSLWAVVIDAALERLFSRS